MNISKDEVLLVPVEGLKVFSAIDLVIHVLTSLTATVWGLYKLWSLPYSEHLSTSCFNVMVTVGILILMNCFVFVSVAKKSELFSRRTFENWSLVVGHLTGLALIPVLIAILMRIT